MPQTTEEPLSDILRRSGYFDADGNLRIEFVARDKIMPLAEQMRRATPPLTMHQIRRFFQHCRGIEARLRAGTSSWEFERSRHFSTLDRTAADALGKSPPKIPQIFHDFILHNVASVQTKKDFLDGFLPHFEALVAFATLFPEERERS